MGFLLGQPAHSPSLDGTRRPDATMSGTLQPGRGQWAASASCLSDHVLAGPAAAAVACRRCFAGKSSRKIPTPTTQVRTSSTNPGVDQGEDSTKKASTHPAASGNLERKPTQDTRRTEPHARTSTSKRLMCTYGTVRSLISAKQHPGTLNTNTTL